MVIRVIGIFALLIFCQGIQMNQNESHGPGGGEELSKVSAIGEGKLRYPGGPFPLFSFGSMLVVDNQELLIYDSAGKYPFYHVNVKEGSLNPHGSWGMGPGEIENGSPVILSKTGEHIYAFEMLSQYLHRFDTEFKYQNSMPVDDIIGMFGVASVLNDQTLFMADYGINLTSKQNQYYFQKYKVENEEISEEYEPALSYDEHPEYQPLAFNNVLKYGPLAQSDNEIYAGNLFGSVITGINETGDNVFQTTMPEQSPIPDAEPREVNGLLVGEPEQTVFRNIDLAVNKNYVFALYSGMEASYEETSKYMTGGEMEDELRIGEARKIRIYDRHEASYKGEYSLPQWTSVIAADNQYLYALVWDLDPYIMVLELPEL